MTLLRNQHTVIAMSFRMRIRKHIKYEVFTIPATRIPSHNLCNTATTLKQEIV